MGFLKRRLRPLLRVVALGLVLGVLAIPVGIAHFDAMPDVCDGAVVHAASDAVRVASGTTRGLHDHCFTCHWLQSFRSTLLASAASVVDAGVACSVPSDATIEHDRLACAAVPARAPPASLPTHD